MRCSLGELEVVYRQLRRQYREEYVMYNLAAAALAQVRAPPGCTAGAARRRDVPFAGRRFAVRPQPGHVPASLHARKLRQGGARPPAVHCHLDPCTAQPHPPSYLCPILPP